MYKAKNEEEEDENRRSKLYKNYLIFNSVLLTVEAVRQLWNQLEKKLSLTGDSSIKEDIKKGCSVAVNDLFLSYLWNTLGSFLGCTLTLSYSEYNVHCRRQKSVSPLWSICITTEVVKSAS